MVLCDPSCAVPVSVRVLKLHFPCLAPPRKIAYIPASSGTGMKSHTARVICSPPREKILFCFMAFFSGYCCLGPFFSHSSGWKAWKDGFISNVCMWGRNIQYICIYIHKNIFRLRICPAIQRVKLRMKEMSCWHLKHLNSIFCCHNTFA